MVYCNLLILIFLILVLVLMVAVQLSPTADRLEVVVDAVWHLVLSSLIATART